MTHHNDNDEPQVLYLWGLPVTIDKRVPLIPPWNGLMLIPPGVDPEPYLEELDEHEDQEPG